MAFTTFTCRRRVRYADVTCGNHVFYSRYLEFIEEARGEFFRAAGIPPGELSGEGFQFPVVDVRIQYLEPARYDDLLTIEVSLVRLNRLRTTMRYLIRNQLSAPLAEATIQHICTGENGRPRRLSAALFDRLGKHLNREDPDERPLQTASNQV